MTNLTRLGKNAEKKTSSVSAINITHDQITTGANEIFVLPDNCLITDVYCLTKVAGQTGLTLDLGFDGSNQLGDDLDIDNTGVTSNFHSSYTALDTGTGQTVTATFSADPTAGEFDIIVEYIEYTKGCGDLTNYAE